MNRFYDIDGLNLLMLSPGAMKSRGITPKDKAWYLVKGQPRFRSDIAKGDIILPEDYATDLASIPQKVQGLFMLHDAPGIGMISPWHDYLYQSKGRIEVLANGRMMPMLLSRQQADQILCEEGMADLGATPDQIAKVYVALRTVGDGWGDNYPISERFHL